MKIDSALKTFTERYDAEAMAYVDSLSNDFSLQVSRSTMEAADIEKAFNTFGTYLEGYAKYMKEHAEDPKRSSREAIRNTTTNLIQNKLFESVKLPYGNVAKFVRGYLDGVKGLLEKVETIKTGMTESGVPAEAVGDVNDFVDEFMEATDNAFYPIMERILRASGYTTTMNLSGRGPKKEEPVFL